MMLWKMSVTENRVDCSIVMVIVRADSYDAMEEKCQRDEGRLFCST